MSFTLPVRFRFTSQALRHWAALRLQRLCSWCCRRIPQRVREYLRSPTVLGRRFRMTQTKMLDRNTCRLCWIEPNEPDRAKRRQPPGFRDPVGEAYLVGLTAAVAHPGRSAKKCACSDSDIGETQ